MPNIITSSPPITNVALSKTLANNGWHKPVTGTHVGCAVCGDSISGRTFEASAVNSGWSSAGLWNTINWLAGAPVAYNSNHAVSGDITLRIMSRISQIPYSTQLVVITTGTNDVLSMSSSANQATIDSTFDTVSGYISAGVNALVAAGKIVVISTILPNNAYSSDTDSRIQLLDRLNAFITALDNNTTIFVVDGFTAMWDSTAPTTRVAKTNYLNSDGTHPTNLGCWAFGIAGVDVFKAAVRSCTPNVDLYRGYQPCAELYSEFFRSTGGTAGLISAGSGTLADGWRSLNTAGDATIVLDATEQYVKGDDFVGSWNNAPVSPVSYFQKFTITNAENNDSIELRLNSSLGSGGGVIDGAFAGSSLFFEIEVLIDSSTNLSAVYTKLTAYFTIGTSPADIPYAGTTYMSGHAGVPSSFSSAVKPVPGESPIRMVLRSMPFVIPENINGSVAISAQASAFMDFCGNGGAVIRFGRPRVWHKMGRFVG